MVLDYVVTFEFLVDAPLTCRGQVRASTAQACARLAVKAAKEKFPKTKFSSLVVVLAQPDVLTGEAHSSALGSSKIDKTKNADDEREPT